MSMRQKRLRRMWKSRENRGRGINVVQEKQNKIEGQKR